MRILHSAAIACGVWTSAASAACSTNLKASYPAPVLNDGWSAQLIAQGLTAPRGILFDSNGGLLVVQQGSGIIHFTWTDDGSTCLTDPQKTFLVNSTDVSSSLITYFSICFTEMLKSSIMELPSPMMARLFMRPLPNLYFHGPTMHPQYQSVLPTKP